MQLTFLPLPRGKLGENFFEDRDFALRHNLARLKIRVYK
jgi:hypothetical protein